MDNITKEKLMEAGVDIESAKERFLGNEELYMRFLMKFPRSPDFEQLKEAMRREECEDAFKAAHAFKGVCGNLSIMQLYEKVCTIVEFLRHGSFDDAKRVYPEVESEYGRVTAILKSI